jgi:hypothetical protein
MKCVARRARNESDTKSWSLDQLKINLSEIRNTLFSIKKTEQALAFFQEYGPWQVKQRLGAEAGTIRLSGLLRERDFYRDALVTREIVGDQLAVGDEAISRALEDFYLWQPLPMEMVFQHPPAVLVRCKDIQDALRASVFLDRMEGFPWRRCGREDCGKVFRIESKHAKRYCTPECAHLQASNDYNERKRDAALKVRAKEKSAKTGGEDKSGQ